MEKGAHGVEGSPKLLSARDAIGGIAGEVFFGRVFHEVFFSNFDTGLVNSQKYLYVDRHMRFSVCSQSLKF